MAFPHFATAVLNVDAIMRLVLVYTLVSTLARNRE